MLTFDEIQAHVAKMTYKRDWSISIDRPPMGDYFNRLFISVSFYTENTYRPGEQTKIGIREPIQGDIQSLSHLEHIVLGFLDQCERHETREWFKIDGVMRFDPHKTEGRVSMA